MNVFRAGIVAVVLAIAVTVVIADARRPSPGALTAVHAQEPRLHGAVGCTQCHGTPDGSMAHACGQCHAAVDGQIAAGTGLHGQLEPATAADCGGCHGEHNGGAFQMVGARSFRLAGIDEIEKFDHAGLSYDLHGRHAELGCQDCHSLAECEVLPAGQTRFLGLSQDCQTCHDDPHQGQLPDCNACHGQEQDFALAARFTHDPRFELTGGHAGVACKACHEPTGEHSVEALAAPQPGAPQPGVPRRAVRECGDCHRSDHSADFLAQTARSREQTVAATCQACHDASDASFFWPAARMAADAHGASGFALASPHAELRCEQCHTDIGGEHGAATTAPELFAARFPGRAADDCASCHLDPHADQFAGTAFADGSAADGATTCIDCHARDAFVPPHFGGEEHARTSFPLTGAHVAVGCNDCHEIPATAGVAANSARVFHGTPSACAACHADVHRGMFDRSERPGDVHGRTDCARCHDTTTFNDVDHASFNHRMWTDFELRGAHARARCEACHAPAPDPEFEFRTFGRAQTRCEDCHVDPHAGQFRREGATVCARCHTDAGAFDELTFDHERDARFALGDNHADLDCAACHREYALPRGGTVVRYRPLGLECTDCHGSLVPQSRQQAGREALPRARSGR